MKKKIYGAKDILHLRNPLILIIAWVTCSSEAEVAQSV